MTIKGAGGDIGKEIANLFVKEGAKFIVADVRKTVRDFCKLVSL
ncbi:MAG: hypothetical protein QM426_09480 [Euryarchaeota archaeon]|nr:hypothetical protein [Euryarchaeota archaeon]